jgi:hypothetical protein
MPIAFDNQCVASVAALRETKMSSSVIQVPRTICPFSKHDLVTALYILILLPPGFVHG